MAKHLDKNSVRFFMFQHLTRYMSLVDAIKTTGLEGMATLPTFRKNSFRGAKPVLQNEFISRVSLTAAGWSEQITPDCTKIYVHNETGCIVEDDEMLFTIADLEHARKIKRAT